MQPLRLIVSMPEADVTARSLVLFDVGATTIKAGVSPGSRLAPIKVLPTPDQPSAILDSIVHAFGDLVRTCRINPAGIRIGCPGLVDASGTIKKALNIALSGCPLRHEIERRTNVPTVVVNDVHAQALGSVGASSSMFYLGLGTGVGGALIDRGRLILGHRGFAGEVGHLPLFPGIGRCPCGQTGCLDALASGRALQVRLGDSWWERKLTVAEKRHLRGVGERVGHAAAVVSLLADLDRVVVAGRLTAVGSVWEGVRVGWRRRGWADARLLRSPETWPQAYRGLAGLDGRLVVR
jgi:predicted NBD/HSP70 family sugar kinase